MIEIKNKTHCSGCFACASICPKKCINMVDDEEGFWYPQIDKEKCVNCGLCQKVCPILGRQKYDNKPFVYAGYCKDLDIRKKSSSGGVFSLLAENVIKKGGVVFGAGFNQNQELLHSFVEKVEDLDVLRGSKYLQSKIGDSFLKVKQFLEAGRQVLFVGTPCQVSGLKHFLGKDYKNLILQDFICHGVPSPKLWKLYKQYHEENAKSKIEIARFRDKTKGWKNYSVCLKFDNNTLYKKCFKKDVMMKFFLKNYCLRPSCYDCSFKGIARESDITLADFWGVQFAKPLFNTKYGTSLIFVHTQKGEKIFQDISSSLRFAKTNLNRAVRFNHSMLNSAKSSKREMFMADMMNLSFEELIKKYK